jgi:hypothetical protein
VERWSRVQSTNRSRVGRRKREQRTEKSESRGRRERGSNEITKRKRKKKERKSERDDILRPENNELVREEQHPTEQRFSWFRAKFLLLVRRLVSLLFLLHSEQVERFFYGVQVTDRHGRSIEIQARRRGSRTELCLYLVHCAIQSGVSAWVRCHEENRAPPTRVWGVWEIFSFCFLVN